MKLFDFIKTYIQRNSSIKLWKELDNGDHLLLTNDKAVMEWEILKVKELSNVEVICIADIGDIPSAINIVIDTSYDGKYITKLFRDLDARLLRERGYDADYKCADK